MSITLVRLVINSPITLSLSARAVVRSAVSESRLDIVSLWPWKTLMIFSLSLLTSVGLNSLNSGFEAVEQFGEVDRGRRRVGAEDVAGFEGDRLISRTAFESQIPQAGEVAVLDHHVGALGQPVAVGVERDQRLVAVVDLHIGNLADAHARDTDIVAGVEHRGIVRRRP